MLQLSYVVIVIVVAVWKLVNGLQARRLLALLARCSGRHELVSLGPQRELRRRHDASPLMYYMWYVSGRIPIEVELKQ